MPVITTKELADAAGVSIMRISQWRKEGLTPIARNQWDSEAALKWIAERREDAGLENVGDIKELRARLYGLQGDAQEIRNDILRGNVILVDTARTVYGQAIADQIQAGDMWVTLADSPTEQKLRRELWFELRERLAGSIEGVCAALSRGEDVAPTRLRYAKRMG